MSTRPHTSADPVDHNTTSNQSPISFAVGFAHQRGWGPYLKAVLLALFSVLVVPAFVLLGYSYRMTRAAAVGAEQPDVANFFGLLVDGVKFFLAILPAALVLGIAMGLVGQVSTTLASLVYFAGLLVLPAVVLSYVASGSIVGAYDGERLSRIAKSGSYLRALLVYFVLALVVSAVTFVSVVTIVGPLLISTFAGLLFAAYWGRVYFDAVQSGEWPAVVAGDDTAPGDPAR